MAEIIQCYREAVPAMRFIGRKYDGFTSWGECFSTDTFGAIERAMGGVEAVRALWKDGRLRRAGTALRRRTVRLLHRDVHAAGYAGSERALQRRL